MNDDCFFDACLLPDVDPRGARPATLCGAVLWGHLQLVQGRDLAKTSAASTFDCFDFRLPLFCAGELHHIVGENDPRFPRDADVISLSLPHDDLLRYLKEPQASRERKGAGMHPEWWPLCGIPRENKKRTVIHIAAREFRSLARGLSRLARAFPNVAFLIDPFLSGKESKWEAGVCLADEPNLWITTRGLYGGDGLWPDRAEREALHFVAGEVGAGKLLFASGMNPQQLSAQTLSPSAWLKEIRFLDDAQRGLVLRQNALGMLRIQK